MAGSSSKLLNGTRKENQKKIQNLRQKKYQKLYSTPCDVFLWHRGTGLLCHFQLHNGQKQFSIPRSFRSQPFDLQAHSRTDLLDWHVATEKVQAIRKDEADISQTRQTRCNCGRKDEKDPKGKRYNTLTYCAAFICFLEGSGSGFFWECHRHQLDT